ncbi:hypothetical protein [Microcoleus anatoxicus]|uniref:Uncharacterized protein n=1 Tax=Microcoleus anatoxicus PTRS2 TaxID=2705321 RepID=A0ABU8YXI2_9CYAN
MSWWETGIAIAISIVSKGRWNLTGAIALFEINLIPIANSAHPER